ncbi:MAG: cytidine deaminase [Acidobacteria bacterium]|nr:cytidine deaminase [Acidobacteriota bacterium]
MNIEKLVEIAREARQFAYAPYSRFRVGAAVECRDGRIFTGANIENSSYGLTLCAERVALLKAVSEGAREITRIAVIADTHGPIPPCGACRQVMLELCDPDALVIMANLRGQLDKRTLRELAPVPFDRSFF